MTTVEPIKSKKDVEKVERYLEKQSTRDHLLFVFGTNSGLRHCCPECRGCQGKKLYSNRGKENREIQKIST